MKTKFLVMGVLSVLMATSVAFADDMSATTATTDTSATTDSTSATTATTDAGQVSQ